jgi:glycerate kinase
LRGVEVAEVSGEGSIQGVDRKKKKEDSCGVGETCLQELKRGWRRTLVSDFQGGDNGLEMVVGLANYHMLVYRDRQM